MFNLYYSTYKIDKKPRSLYAFSKLTCAVAHVDSLYIYRYRLNNLSLTLMDGWSVIPPHK